MRSVGKCRGILRFTVGSRRRAACFRTALFALAASAVAARLEAAMSVSVVTTPSGPAPVGTMISFKAEVFGGSEHLWYRFRVREIGESFRTIRDYGLSSVLDWTSLDEGFYVLELSVQDRSTLETAFSASTVRMVSRVQGEKPVVSPTSHPLVFLFSSPPCEKGRARVEYRSEDGVVRDTPAKPCLPGRSLNFYLAALAARTSYSARVLLDGIGRSDGGSSEVVFQTGDVPPTAASAASVLRPAAAQGSEGILLQAPLFPPPIATDLNGKLLWFGPYDISYVTRPEREGTFFGVIETGNDPERNAVRRFDLVGMTVQETSVARVNDQLVALGKRPITAFHHEARSLPGGKTLVLGSVEDVLTDVQGLGRVHVIGDMIIVLDADLQVEWSWDAFDHLDTSRRAVLGETCRTTIGCPPHDESADANDWTHANSVARAPDGALLLSVRHQDWLIKIDYRDGAGQGDVIWRLGKDGDFTYDAADPYPWFSHQHDAAYEPGSVSKISLFDNGNTRYVTFPAQSSRGQAIELVEERRSAHLAVNVDLKVFSGALGSAQKLPDGSYHFNAGLVSDPSSAFGASAFSMQLDPEGNVFSSIKLPVPVYRSFRLHDLYGSSDPPARPGARTVAFR